MAKNRLLGIEIGRGLSTYAVVLVHSGDETWGIPISSLAIEFRLFFYFAVPFFLATAFYFMTFKPTIGYSYKFWKSRFERILLPYFMWSIIFLILRIVFLSLTDEPERIQSLIQDPLSIIFFGRASYQLYFIPLLMAGTSLVLLSPLLERVNASALIFLSGLSIFINYFLDSSGNSFQLGSYVAFAPIMNSLSIDLQSNPMLRLITVILAWNIGCLPYFLVASSLNRLSEKRGGWIRNTHPLLWFFSFLITNLFLRSFLPIAFSQILVAFSLLLFCLSLSMHLEENNKCLNPSLLPVFRDIGICSFGIYLCHPLFMNIVKPLIRLIFYDLTSSVTILSILLISLLSFLSSWITVNILFRSKLLSKYLLGV